MHMFISFTMLVTFHVQILWMCGGHQEHRSKVIESAGVQPKTRGDVVPCNPLIKSSLGINHFNHLRDILKESELS